MARKLSYSQVSTFTGCPRKWHLAYIEGWRSREKSEALVLGSAVHRKIAEFLGTGAMGNVSTEDLREIEDPSKQYHLSAMAAGMLQTFSKHINTMGGADAFHPIAIEQHLYRDDFHGYVDCIADVDDHRVVIDWKTTKYPYPDWRAHVDDQLTAYAWLVEPDYQIDEVAFVTLQKPHGKVTWHRSMRSQQQMDDFAQKVLWARRQMHRGVMHRNPGNCGWCSYRWHCAFGEDLAERNERDDF